MFKDVGLREGVYCSPTLECIIYFYMPTYELRKARAPSFFPVQPRSKGNLRLCTGLGRGKENNGRTGSIDRPAYGSRYQG